MDPTFSSQFGETRAQLDISSLHLIWKGKLGIPDAVEIYVPNPANDFSRMGVRATATLTSRLRLSADVSYNIRGKRGYSRTLVLEREF